MGKIFSPKPVKLVISMFTSGNKIFEVYQKLLIKKFGEVDIESNTQIFNYTDYYEDEFGQNLMQKLLSFSTLIRPEELVEIKTITNDLEKNNITKDINSDINEYKRIINIDPGYISLDKFILASTKNGPSRIYLNQGIYAEITLRFIRKSFVPCEYTYPNYKTSEYMNFLISVRQKYKLQLKEFKNIVSSNNSGFDKLLHNFKQKKRRNVLK